MTLDTYSYATLAQMLVETKINAGEEDRLMQAAAYATARLEQELNLTFVPVLQTLEFRRPRITHADGIRYLALPEPVVAITSFTDAGGTALVLNTDYQPANQYQTPWWELAIESGALLPYGLNNVARLVAQTCFHENYGKAWANGATLSAAITDSDETASVQPGEGALFSVGQVIRIGTEDSVVTAVDTDELTLIRGVNGTTAAAHADDAPVTRFRPDPFAVRFVARYGSYLYKRQSAFESTVYDGVGTVSYPSDLPGEMQTMVDDFKQTYLLWVTS